MITSLYAGLLGLIYLVLTFFTIKGRFKHQVSLGHGDNKDMEKRIRMHANFAEYVPIAILLIFLSEMGNMSSMLIHAMGIVLIVGRTLHAVGLYGLLKGNSRPIGMVMTVAVIAVASISSVMAYFLGAQ